MDEAVREETHHHGVLLAHPTFWRYAVAHFQAAAGACVMGQQWYPRYPGDYAINTRHFTLEQHGAYALLLDWSWENGAIPDDPKIIARILGVHTNRAKTLWGFFRPLLSETKGGFVSKRLEKERAKCLDVSAKRKKAAERRWDANAYANGDASGMHPQPHNIVDKSTMAQQRPGEVSFWDVWRSLPGADRGAFLGRLISQHGEAAVSEAVAKTAAKRPADPMGYITGILRPKVRKVVL